jgi:hypothetical protein
MNAEEKREQRLKLLDDHIGRALQDSARSGELARAPSYGKPLHFGDGFEETPDALKLPYKMLKDAGFVPPEVQVMKDIAALQAEIDASPLPADAPEHGARRQRIADLRQALALRLEKLRSSGAL